MSNSISAQTSSAAVRTSSIHSIAIYAAIAVVLAIAALVGHKIYESFQPLEIGACYSTNVKPGESIHSSALRALEENNGVNIDRVSGLTAVAQRANANKQLVLPGNTTSVCLTPNGKKVASVNGINAR